MSVRISPSVAYSDLDPALRHAACVILLRGGDAFRQPIEIYIVRRNKSLKFLAGYHAFPGGGVEPIDDLLTATGETVHRATAVREMLEETGVLAGVAFADKVPTSSVVRDIRQKLLDSDFKAWGFFIKQYGVSLVLTKLIDIGYWITPPHFPIRFWVPYFVVRLPVNQAPTIIEGELTEGDWYTAEEAINKHNCGELRISYPVLKTLQGFADGEHLASFKEGEQLPAVLEHVASTVRSFQGNAYPYAGGEICAGVHIIPCPTKTLPPATHTNCYLMGDKELALIDPAAQTVAGKNALNDYIDYVCKQKQARLTAIWLTHHHADHIGAIVSVQKRFNVPLCAHQYTAERLPQALTVDHLLIDQEILTLEGHSTDYPWEVLHTPGHAVGHLCFYNAERGHLVTGDNVLGFGSVLIAPPEGDMKLYLASLSRMADRKLTFLYPAHGAPVAAPYDKIAEYIAHRLARESAIVAQLTTDPKTIEQIVNTVYIDIDPRALPLAALNVEAHLRWLQEQEQEKVCRVKDGWVLRGKDIDP